MKGLSVPSAARSSRWFTAFLRDSQALNSLARHAPSATSTESISLVTLSLKGSRPGSGGNFSTANP
jgi:hypothetical protein